MSSESSFLDKLRAVVLENYTDENFGVSELVDKIGISRSQLHRKLKAANGKSVSQFIREVRLDEAYKLLKDDDLTASEVAYRVSFNSATYFNTSFNDYFGFPPGEVKHQGSDTDSAVHESSRTPYRNKRIAIWLLVITVLVVSFFAIKYFRQDNSLLVQTGSEKAKTIAVLPFKNWSGDPELEYVSDGMTDAVIRRLSAISEIERVIPFTSILVYKNSDKTTKEIAEELDVEYILTGNFKLSGEDVMSNLDLIETDTNDYLWSLEYKGVWNSNEIFEMQTAVAENIAANMSAEISATELENVTNIPTRNAEAYKSYLKAEFNYEKLSPAGFSMAEEFYKHAIELDSSFIEPYLGLASNYFISGLVWGGMPQDIARQEGSKYLELAEGINSDNNGVYDRLFLSVKLFRDFYYEWDFVSLNEHVEEFERIPFEDLFLTEIAGLLEYNRKFGNMDKAIKYATLSYENRVAESGIITGLSFVYYMKGNNEKALEILDESNPRYTSDFFYLMESAKVYYYLEEYEKSKRQLDLFLATFPQYPPIISWLRAVHAEIEGDYVKVDAALDQLQMNYKMRTSGSPAWFMALYHCHIKDYDTAFEWFNKSFDHHEVELTWFMEEPMIQSLKDDPRYIELYKKIGFDVVEPLELIKD